MKVWKTLEQAAADQGTRLSWLRKVVTGDVARRTDPFTGETLVEVEEDSGAFSRRFQRTLEPDLRRSRALRARLRAARAELRGDEPTIRLPERRPHVARKAA